jgi:hypothetical protein
VLPCIVGWKVCATTPSQCLRCCLVNILPGPASQSLPHKLLGLKGWATVPSLHWMALDNRNVLLWFWRLEGQDQGVSHHPSETLSSILCVFPHLWWWAAVLGVSWFTVLSLHPLPLSQNEISLCAFRTPWSHPRFWSRTLVTHRSHSECPHFSLAQI